MASKGDAPNSIAAYERAMRTDPNNPECHNNLGVMLSNERRFTEAAGHFRRAIKIKPDYPDPHRNLGAVLTTFGEYDAGMECFQAALRLRPRYVEAHCGIGVIHSYLGNYDEAMAAYSMALAINPVYPEAHRNIAILRLVQGDLRRGFGQYEWRWKCSDTKLGVICEPQWDGSDLTGKTIFINSEQGLGDTIQFVRYLPLVKAKNPARIIFVTEAALIPLFRRTYPWVDDYVPYGKHAFKFDASCSLINLAGALGTTLETIPGGVPYLHATEAAAAKWRNELDHSHRSLNVGLKWRGNPVHGRDRDRSVPVQTFEPLLRLPGVRFFSLQTGPESKEPLEAGVASLLMRDWGGRFDLSTFEDAAGACAALDLIISVDTSLVHLAGAMGRPVWNLIICAPDWRWLLDRSDSPWYPTVRLFRQPRYGDWESVIHEVVCNLQLEVMKHGNR